MSQQQLEVDEFWEQIALAVADHYYEFLSEKIQVVQDAITRKKVQF